MKYSAGGVTKIITFSMLQSPFQTEQMNKKNFKSNHRWINLHKILLNFTVKSISLLRPFYLLLSPIILLYSPLRRHFVNCNANEILIKYLKVEREGKRTTSYK